MAAYYNEIDLYAAQWLRNLIAAGHIADGVVDTRSIEDVHPADLQEFTQCHFFAGVGVWSLALRNSGWSDDRPVWTGSCPCQPFSAAGQGAGFADERHLWPAFGHLIAQCKPAIVLGEQVASKDVDVWIDLVHADLEALGYAFGSVPFPSAGIGAPHIRDRNYWVANANGQQRSGRQRAIGAVDEARGWQQGTAAIAGLRFADGLEHARLDHDAGKGQASGAGQSQAHRSTNIIGRSGVPLGRLAHDDQHGCGAHAGAKLHDTEHHSEPRSSVRGLADADGEGRRDGRQLVGSDDVGIRAASAERSVGGKGIEGFCTAGDPGPTNGFWRDADWLGCTDGKWRPVEPGTFPLAHGAASRVGRLRAYGNAINAEAARVWVETVMESL